MKYKFRGMSVETKEWVYGDLVHRGYDGTSRLVPVGIASPMYYPIEVIPETVGMWIGKYDRNGDEVYEGDIIAYDSIDGLKMSHTITFNKKDLCYEGYVVEGIIIGNIYEKEKPV